MLIKSKKNKIIKGQINLLRGISLHRLADFASKSLTKSYENFKVPEVIVNRDDYKTKYVFNNYNLRCNTVIQLTNEISQFDRIFKLYVLNFREYFKINVLKTTC